MSENERVWDLMILIKKVSNRIRVKVTGCGSRRHSLFNLDLIKVFKCEAVPVPRLKLKNEAGEQLNAGLLSRGKRGIPSGSILSVRLAFVAG